MTATKSCQKSKTQLPTPSGCTPGSQASARTHSFCSDFFSRLFLLSLCISWCSLSACSVCAHSVSAYPGCAADCCTFSLSNRVGLCSTIVHIQFVWQVLATFLCSTFGHIQFVQQPCAHPVRVTYPLRVTSGGTLEGSPDTSTASPRQRHQEGTQPWWVLSLLHI